MKVQNWEFPNPGIPNFEKPHINYPDGSPEFKKFRGGNMMDNIIQGNTPEQNGFISISDFEDCMIRGGEVEFVWNGKTYDVTHTATKIGISEAYKQETEGLYDTAEEVLDYLVGEDKLRDIITKVEVIVRTI